MKEEALTVGRKDKGYIQHVSIIESLLHSSAQTLADVLGLDDGNDAVRDDGKGVVCKLLFASGCHLALHHDAAISDCKISLNLRVVIPPGLS